MSPVTPAKNSSTELTISTSRMNNDSDAMGLSVERPTTPISIPNQKLSTVEAFSSQPSIYVSNIPHTSKNALITQFSEFGSVLDAYFVGSSRSSPPASDASARSSQCAFVATQSAIIKFESWTDAERAYEHFSNSIPTPGTSEVPLQVRYARPRYDFVGDSISAKRLFIGQLPAHTARKDVETYFSQFGNLVDVSLLGMRSSSQQGCAFVEFDTWAACDRAIAAGHGKIVFSDSKLCRPMVVKYAKSKDRSVAGLPGPHVHAYPYTGTLQELLMGSQVHVPTPHPSSPPTVGYVMCQEHIPHTVPAFWPVPPTHSAANSFQMHPLIECLPYYPDYVPVAVHPPYASTHVQPTCMEDVDSRKIFVGQLPRNASEDDVVSLFSIFGPIENVTVLRTGPRCGFVTFATRYQALVAVAEMHGVVPYEDGRPLVVRVATKRGDPVVTKDDTNEEDTNDSDRSA